MVVVGISNTDYLEVYKDDAITNEMIRFLPEGLSDIWAIFEDGSVVIKENVVNSPDDPITIEKSEAENSLTFEPLDENGSQIASDDHWVGVSIIHGRNRNYAIYFKDVLPFKISDVNHYKVNWEMSTRPLGSHSNLIYDLKASSPTGIFESHVYSNDPSAFTTLNIKNPNVDEASAQTLWYYARQTFGRHANTMSPVHISNPFHVLYTRDTELGYLEQGSMLRLSAVGDENNKWETSMFIATKDQGLLFSSFIPSRPLENITNTTEFDYTLGGTIPHISGRPFYNPNYNSIAYGFNAMGIISRHYGERENGMVDFTLVNPDSSVVIHQQIRNSSALIQSDPETVTFYTTDAPQGNYTLGIRYNQYQLDGHPGTFAVNFKFNNLLGDPAPPELLLFNLRNEAGVSTNRISSDEQGMIQFQITDRCDLSLSFDCGNPSDLASVTLEYRKSETDDWQSLNTELINEIHWVKLPLNLPVGQYSLRLTARDNSDNELEQIIEPAFVVAEPGNNTLNKVALLDPVHESNLEFYPQFVWTSQVGGLQLYIADFRRNEF